MAVRKNKHEWVLRFEINAGEYSGYTVVKARSLAQIDQNTVVADGVEITLDEEIISIEKDGITL